MRTRNRLDQYSLWDILVDCRSLVHVEGCTEVNVMDVSEMKYSGIIRGKKVKKTGL